MKKTWANNSFLITRKISLASEWQERAEISSFCTDIDVQVRSASAEIIKDDAMSTVSVVPFNGGKLVIKQFNFTDTFHFLRRTFRHSKAKNLWDNAHLLSKIGIKTVKPVALIEDRFAFFRIRSFFVGTYIQGQNAGSFFNDAGKTDDEYHTAAQKIVESLSRLHDTGIYIGDTRGKNILIGPDKVFWLDIEELSCPRWNWLRSLKELRDWQVFFDSWRNNNCAQQLFHKAAKEALGVLKYSKLVHCAASYRRKKFTIAEFHSKATLACTSPDRLFAQVEKIAQGVITSDWEKVVNSRKAIVARKKNAEVSLYCKVFLKRNWREGLKKLFRLSRAARTIRNEQMMKAAGFLVPETLYWGKCKEREYVVSKEIDGTSFPLWLTHHHCTPEMKRKALQCLGEEVAVLHLVGFVHGDLRLHNIMIQETDGGFKIFFLDNESTKLYRKIPRKLIIQNLRQINTDPTCILSKTDRLRIFRAYQNIHGRFTRDEERTVIAQIERLTEKVLEISRKRRRAALSKMSSVSH